MSIVHVTKSDRDDNQKDVDITVLTSGERYKYNPSDTSIDNNNHLLECPDQSAFYQPRMFLFEQHASAVSEEYIAFNTLLHSGTAISGTTKRGHLHA